MSRVRSEPWLTSLLASYFDAATIARANSRRGHTRVKVLARDESHIIGLVRDREGVTHSTSWHLIGGSAKGSCTCGECSVEGVLCDHLWMLALEAEHFDALTTARQWSSLRAGTANDFD